MRLVNTHQQKRGIPTMLPVLEWHFSYSARTIKSVKHGLFFICKGVCVRFLLHCTPAYSDLSLNVVLIMQMPSFSLSRIIRMNICDEFEIIVV